MNEELLTELLSSSKEIEVSVFIISVQLGLLLGGLFGWLLAKR